MTFGNCSVAALAAFNSKSFNPIGIKLENTQQLSEKICKVSEDFYRSYFETNLEYPRKNHDIKKFLLKPTESNTVKNL
jgi:hypothetical protein